MKKLITLTLASMLLLGACSASEEKEPDKEAVKKSKYDLVYFEQLSNGDKDELRVEIGYKKDGKVKHFTTSSKKLYEHILKDENAKPYVVKDGKKYHVYRTPYMTYSGNEIEGEVTGKSEVKDK
ncbi:hypothetical protein ACF3N8_03320 [Staphylococcus massiliensis]|uniref:hypothetical protein n=1 Tax=Staphylococcus massiliensis TaxID=555791 RepID=UPI001EDF571A|nr:hypothetical protein [Staphylococcus massiliensis]MCG3412773.1 hypothetical protein [Staphylococcus massiliensis]